MFMPHPAEILSLRVKGRHRFRPQLKGAPYNFSRRLQLDEFCQGWLRQPTERSEVIRIDFKRYRLFHFLFRLLVNDDISANEPKPTLTRLSEVLLDLNDYQGNIVLWF